MQNFFFDLPVYRLPERQYYEQREAHVSRHLQRSNNTRLDTAFEDHLQRTYGGPWRFNEVVGYVRLHFLGSQVRGEYFAVDRKRLVRTRTKTLFWQTWKLAPEVEIPSPITDDGVWSAIKAYVDRCRKELKGRFLDTDLLETLAPHVRWAELLRVGLK